MNIYQVKERMKPNPKRIMNLIMAFFQDLSSNVSIVSFRAPFLYLKNAVTAKLSKLWRRTFKFRFAHFDSLSPFLSGVGECWLEWDDEPERTNQAKICQLSWICPPLSSYSYFSLLCVGECWSERGLNILEANPHLNFKAQFKPRKIQDSEHISLSVWIGLTKSYNRHGIFQIPWPRHEN